MEHLTNDLLVRHLDDELTPPEIMTVESHLAKCEGCRSNFAALRKASVGVDDFFLSLLPEFDEQERGDLARALAAQEGRAGNTAGRQFKLRGMDWSWMGNHRWAAAIAATMIAGVLYVGAEFWQDQRKPVRQTTATTEVQSAVLTTFDIDGETFWALPYSNPELPVNAPRVVQMEVPVASLADAGIMVEPVATRAALPDRAVLADVLLGVDGQPVGVHVLSMD